MMNLLSLELINKVTAYPIVRNAQDGFFHFFTDGGVHYSVGFIEEDTLLSKESYQLIIANLNNRKSMRDKKVRDTIVAIVDEFFNRKTYYWLCPCICGCAHGAPVYCSSDLSGEGGMVLCHYSGALPSAWIPVYVEKAGEQGILCKRGVCGCRSELDHHECDGKPALPDHGDDYESDRRDV